MRTTQLFFLLATCLASITSAFAAAPSEFMGQSALYQVWFDDPRESPGSVINFAGFDEMDGELGEYSIEAEPVPFDAECVVTDAQIVCRPDGQTPLAGATYQLHMDGYPTCPGADADERYTCVEGCRPGVPKFLKFSPYEC